MADEAVSHLIGRSAKALCSSMIFATFPKVSLSLTRSQMRFMARSARGCALPPWLRG